jgi:DNA-binding MarR family transcriptional regulator
LTRQVLRPQVLSAWIGLLRSHAELTRAMNARLLAEHGLTVNDYDVLVQLADTPEQALRRVDLAERVVLSPSGITRLLDGLEAQGYVAKRRCDSDARVTYAALTEAGAQKLQEASLTHLADVEDLFAARFSEEELAVLGDLLGRLGGTERCPGAGVAIAEAAVAGD